MNDDKERVTKLLLSKKYAMEMGANKLASWWRTTPETIRECKKDVRKINKESRLPRVPKVLLLDIEVLPGIATIFSPGKQYVTPESFIKRAITFSWKAKWLFGSSYFGEILTPREIAREDNKRIIKPVWDLLNESDIIIGHNLNRFDIRWLNSEFLLNKLKPTLPYKTIDTLVESRKSFMFPSYSLDNLGKLLSLRRKMESDYQLWQNSRLGDKKALDYIFKYNEKDVELLEEVYLEIRPWIKSHPNMNLYIESDKSACSNCGSSDIKWSEKPYCTNVSKFASFRCNKCGAISRCRVSDLSKEERDRLLVSVAF